MPIAQYETYKDSGIQWLGQIPEHWQIKRIKDFADVVRGGSPRPAGDSRFYGGNIPFLRVADLTSNEEIYLNTHTYTITEAGLNNTRFVKANTLLLTNSGATLGIPKICTFPTTFNDGVAAFLGIRVISKIFLFYFLKNRTTTFLNEASLGQGQPNLNTGIISQVIIGFPPPAEQTAIAQYLDQKTAAIDKKITLLEQKISTYQDLRKSLINETVCRGLDKSVPFKESGIDWIGQIPVHWKVKRLKDVGRTILGKMLNNTPSENYFLKPYLKSKNIGWLRGSFEEVETMYFNKHELKSYRIRKNDLLVSEGGEVGKTCIWKNELEECYIQNSVHKITMYPPNKSEYFLYLFFSIGVANYFESIVNQVSIKHLTWEKLVKITIVVPPFEEQTAIANYLDEKTQTIDAIVKNLKDQIETLKEFRKTLINDVVTGKIRVAADDDLNQVNSGSEEALTSLT